MCAKNTSTGGDQSNFFWIALWSQRPQQTAHLGGNFADQIWNVWRDAVWKMNYQLALKGTSELSPGEFQPVSLT